MIYLIGGSPRSGKTTLATKLSQRHDISCISADELIPFLKPYFKAKDREISFPFEKLFNISNVDDLVTGHTKEDIFKADIVEARTIWPGIQNLISYIISRKRSFIIEGVSLLPELLNTYKDNKNIKIIFLTKVDKPKILAGLMHNKNNNDWLIDNIHNENAQKKAVDLLNYYGKHYEKETKKYGYKCINTENNFLKKIDEAIGYLED